ncbi:hypothetical protein LEP1GSC021_3598 [Leptospira noguchii str. 1993005606]|uniref:Uncharacterized protein n=2 Tax=Leptospira noguchii TaxID=28182 RepID=M6UJ92_9LEPT|nr:hypothetical protein LEP1GSC035_1339 [Leptospira noguchii str. 2007001578]EMO42881.1 hypothetical protein LEP1GSC186_0102 [Leptospira noguchii serovar Autumnalis str. ZUN142]EPE84567.1 hypothetical protein LEP1GSC021_3598 [Leptospira noguchii str. 1993005606]
MLEIGLEKSILEKNETPFTYLPTVFKNNEQRQIFEDNE